MVHKGQLAGAPLARATDSTSVQDYVKVIYSHTEWQDSPMTTSGLAAKLGLAPSSVTEMVKKLTALELVTHVPYGSVTLTDKGVSLALEMVRRHRLIETFLVQSFGYGWEEVHDEAEVLEHVVSPRLLDGIAALLGYPTRDPHGDPIPSAEGTIVMPAVTPLAEVAPGTRCSVARISDDNAEMLIYLAGHGIVLDAELVVGERAPFGGPLSVTMAGGTGALALGAEITAAVWVAAP